MAATKTRLINLAQAFGDEGRVRPKFEVAEAWAKERVEQYYTFKVGKGYSVMITEADAKRLGPEIARGLTDKILNRRGKKQEQFEGEVKESWRDVGPMSSDVVKTIIDAHFAEWKNEIETMLVDQDDRVGSLHKLAEATVNAYESLRKQLDVPMKDLPALPVKYKFRILIVGNDVTSIQALKKAFPDVRFTHVGASRNEKLGPGTLLPQVDLILVMTSFVSHQVRNAVEKRYGVDKVNYIKGSTSAAESAIQLWLVEQRRHSEEAQE